MNAFLAMTGRSPGGAGEVEPPPPVFDVSWLNGGLIAGAGDSLTRGVGSTLNVNGYLPQLQALLAGLGCAVDVFNEGVDSATTAGINVTCVTNIDPLFDSGRVCVFLYQGGGNDIFFSGDAAVAGAITGNWAGLDNRVSGWRKILIVSPDRGIDPSTGPPVETTGGQDRTDYRASMDSLRSGLVAGYATHAEQIVQLQNNPALVCTDLAVCNSDETHWKDAGYGRWAGDNYLTEANNVLAVLGTMS